MKKLKVVGIILGSIIAIFVLIGFIISTVYEDKVKAYIVEQINESINTKIDVKDVHFSVFKKFPYASLEFEEVTAEEVINSKNKKNLFSAQSVYLQFNILDILNENYIIKKVELNDGVVNIKIDKYGHDNYHIWKKSEDGGNKLSVELEDLTFKQVDFYFLNEYKGLDMDIEVVNLSLSGNFSKDDFTLTTKAQLYVNQINDENEVVFKNKNVKVNTSLAVNQKTQVYNIKKGEITIEQLKFSLAGNLTNKEVGVELNIQSKGNELDFNELFSLLPAAQKNKLNSYETVGIITYESTIVGELSIKKSPSFNAKFNLANGSITEKSSGQSFTNINFKGDFTNGKNNDNNTSKLSLNELDANFGAGHISGNCEIFNFSNPQITFDSKSIIDLATAKEFFKWDTIASAEGNLELNIHYNGTINELNNIKAQDLRKLNATGTARLINSSFKVKESTANITNANGSFRFNNNDVQIDTLKFHFNNSQFDVDGKFKNLLAFLFIENEHLGIKTNFHADKLVLEDLLSVRESNNKESNYTIKLPPNISLNFNASVDTFLFRKFTATNFKGQVTLDHQILTATDVSFNSMKGVVRGNMAIDDSKGDEILITSKVTTEEIDIRDLFYQFEDFGQQQISHSNIGGRTTTSVEFASVWNKQLVVNQDKIYVLADVTIKNGELKNYKPVMAMSKFIEVEELEHIKFNNLTTQVEIKNKTVTIPKTEINSSALDLTISGTHTFNNEIDYRFKVLMSDVLWKKAKNKKKENTEFGYVQDDGLGRTTLFLHMYGTIDNYKIAYDTKGLKESWAADLKEEKQTLKTILNKEFGWFKNDSTLKKEEPKDHGFEIEWEEEEEPNKSSEKTTNKTQKTTSEKKKKKKKGLGKFIDKVAQPDEEEYEERDDL